MRTEDYATYGMYGYIYNFYRMYHHYKHVIVSYLHARNMNRILNPIFVIAAKNTIFENLTGKFYAKFFRK
jgi:hypothetical protein